MKEFNFGGNRNFYLGGENTGNGIWDHEIQISREDFSELMKNILSKDEIEIVLCECRYEDALAWANFYIYFKKMFNEKPYKNQNLYRFTRRHTIEELVELAEELKLFLERSEDIVQGYSIVLEMIREHDDGYNKKAERLSKIVTGHVYFIGAENGLYKIGKAKNIKSRIKGFGQMFPIEWRLEHSFQTNDYTKAEKYLHEKFSEKRVRGEWFQLSTEDVTYITSIEDFSL